VPIQVRRTGPADVDDWVRLRVAFLREARLWGEDPLEESQQAAATRTWLVERLDRPDFAAFIAVLDEQPAGSGGVSLYDVPPTPTLASREAYIMSMYTEPVFRHRGVARAVLEAILDFVRAEGAISRVWLRTTESGRPLYEGYGFEGRDTYMFRRP
jgi:GNAT superfamily N-acetyltransferase